MQKNTVLGRLTIIILFFFLLSGCQTSEAELVPSSKKTVLPKTGEISSSDTIKKNTAAADYSSHSGVSSKAGSKRADNGSLTLEAAVRRAVAWHPAVDEATGRIYEADERIRAAEAGYYPQLKAGIGSGYQSRNRDSWRPDFNITASQLLYDFGKVSGSVNFEKAGKNLNHARLLAAVDNLSRDTANALIEVQRYEQLSGFAQAQVEGVRRIAGLVEERTNKGASTMSDKVQADARVETALATQLQYQSELDRWQVALGSLIGSASARPVSDVPAWLSKSCDVANPVWEDVPAMLQAEAEKEEAKAQLSMNKAEAMPTVSLEASTNYDLNGSYNNTTDRDRRLDYSVGLNVSSSLYNGGRTNAKKRAAAYALETADAAIRRARYDVQRNLMEARSQIGSLSRLQGSLKTRASMMVQTRDLYREQYLELGTRTLLDLLNAEQELHESRFQLANTEHDLRLLNIGCLYNSGKLRNSFGINPDTLRGGATVQ